MFGYEIEETGKKSKESGKSQMNKFGQIVRLRKQSKVLLLRKIKDSHEGSM